MHFLLGIESALLGIVFRIVVPGGVLYLGTFRKNFELVVVIDRLPSEIIARHIEQNFFGTVRVNRFKFCFFAAHVHVRHVADHFDVVGQDLTDRAHLITLLPWGDVDIEAHHWLRAAHFPCRFLVGQLKPNV